MRKLLLLFLLAYCPAIMAVTCNLITTRTETDGGVFSLASYKDKLHVGMFGYDYDANTPSQVMLFQLNGSTFVPSDLTKSRLEGSESICAMREFKGHLYAATESSGRMFRSSEGLVWDKIYNGPHRDACDLHDNGITLIAPQTHGGVVLYTTNGTTWDVSTVTTEGRPYIRESNFYDGYWYVWGIRRSDNSRFGYKSLDLQSWTNISVPGRVFRTSIIDGMLWASLAGQPPYQAQNKVGLYNTHNGTNWVQKYLSTFDTYSHTNTLYKVRLDEDRDRLIATTSTGFKPRSSSTMFGGEGSGALHEFTLDGSYVGKLFEFADQEYVEATAWHNGEFYVGTMHGGYHPASSAYIPGSGKVFKCSGITQAPQTAGSSIVPILQLLLLD